MSGSKPFSVGQLHVLRICKDTQTIGLVIFSMLLVVGGTGDGCSLGIAAGAGNTEVRKRKLISCLAKVTLLK